eukprot:TRINITY_DN2639_c0_g1_i2.p1 TRINITY_DN2639_c0_g1~~TRINITY_DN2639_c0_g1_i2.p1  ORF type:complete len:465 (+),score=126.52 TRINITY_DN2639_c0_g1_i2:104-1498(+)
MRSAPELRWMRGTLCVAAELRIDPADGGAYPYSSFVQVYGEEARARWESAELALDPGCPPAPPPPPLHPPAAAPHPLHPPAAAPDFFQAAAPKPRAEVPLPPAGRVPMGRLTGRSKVDVFTPSDIVEPVRCKPGCYPAQLSDLSLGSRVLLVGEGNFSLSRDLAKKLHDGGLDSSSLHCTAYDSEVQAREKYPDIDRMVMGLQAQGARVLFQFDATDAGCYRSVTSPVDAVIFHFPHTGVKQHYSVKVAPEVIQASIDSNKELLRNFFKAVAASPNVANSAVFVTLKTGYPYSLWELERGAALEGWALVAAVPFEKDAFPLYDHRRTLPNANSKGRSKSVQMKDAFTHQFRLDPAAAARTAALPSPVAPATMPEMRIDPADGQPYTKEDFMACYGGTEEWESAGEELLQQQQQQQQEDQLQQQRPPSPPLAPKQQPPPPPPHRSHPLQAAYAPSPLPAKQPTVR